MLDLGEQGRLTHPIGVNTQVKICQTGRTRGQVGCRQIEHWKPLYVGRSLGVCDVSYIIAFRFCRVTDVIKFQFIKRSCLKVSSIIPCQW